MSDEIIRVLSIEDNPGDARLIHKLLLGKSSLGWDLPTFELEWVKNLTAGLARLNAAMSGDAASIDAVLTDLDLPDSRAGDTFTTLRARYPHLPIVVLTGREDEELAVNAVRAGAQDYLYKREMSNTLLAHAISYAIERQQANDTLRKAHDELELRVAERTAELAEINTKLIAELAARQQAENELRIKDHAITSSVNAIAIADLAGNLTYVNPAFLRLWGYNDETEVLGRHATRFWQAEEQAAQVIEALRQQDGWIGEMTATRKDGTPFEVQLSASMVRDEKDAAICMMSAFVDVTARKRAEEALRESERRYREIFEGSRDGFVMVDGDGCFIDANQAYCDMLGYSLAELRQKRDFYEITPARWREWEREEIWENRLLKRGYSGVYEKEYVRKDGTIFPVELQSYTVFDARGELQYLWGVARDITARKRAEKTLRESEEKFRTLVDQAADMLLLHDMDGNIQDVNQASVQQYGYTREELLAMKVGELDPDYEEREDAGRFWEEFGMNQPRRFEARQMRKDGTIFPVEVTVTKVMIHGEMCVMGLCRDITARKRAEEQLRFQAMLMDQIRDSIVATDLEGRITYTNEAAVKSLKMNKEELIKQSVDALGEDAARGATQQEIITATLADGEWQGDVVNYARNGTEKIWDARTWLIYDEHGAPKGMVGISTDITQRRKTEERVKYLNSVLRAIRNVNQLITQEPDRDRMLQKSCENLVETLGFHNAWIALVDEAEQMTTAYAAGFDDDFAAMATWLEQNGLPQCGAAGLACSEVTAITAPKTECEDCPLAEGYKDRSGLIARLWYRDKVYGILTVSAPAQFAEDAEVHNLVQEVAGDIAFALWKLEMEAARQHAEAALRESERELRLTLDATTEGIWKWNFQTDELVFSPRYYRMLGYEPYEFAATYENWLDLIHPDDREAALAVATEYLRTKPDIYENEFRLRTKDGDYRWIQATARVVERDENGEAIRMIGNHRDITERKRAEIALYENQQLLQAILDSSPAIIFVKDVEGRYILLNKQYEKMWHLDSAEVRGKTDFELFPEEVAERVTANDRAVLETGQARQLEEYVPQDDGMHTFISHKSPLYDAAGEIYAVCGIATDITERKRAEEKLRESERRWHTLLQNIHAAVVVHSEDTSIVTCNNRAQELLGLTEDQMLGKTAIAPDWKFIREDGSDMPIEMYPVHQVQRTRQPLRDFIMGVHRPKQHDIVWVSVDVDPTFDHQGELAEMVVTFMDITAYRQAEQKLRESEEKYRRLVELSPDLIAIHRAGEILYINEAGIELLGVEDAAQAIGQPVTKFVSPTHREVSKERMQRLLNNGKRSPIYEQRIIRPNGTEREVEVVGIPFSYQGEMAVQIIAHDVTARKHAEDELKRYAAELHRSNEDLQQFAYVASHDLKEPLRTIKSYLGLLQEDYQGRLDELADEFIGFAVDGAARMEQMIESLLEYARVDMREKEFAVMDTEAILDTVLQDLSFRIEESDAVVTHDALPQVLGDEAQLEQLFQNLISNALKFCADEPPRVHVSATAAAQGEERREWLFAVRDNGIGIAAEQQARLFGVFQRLHTREEYEGIGIGLALCKKIVARHGGRIWVESKEGEGATFYFTLPCS